MFWFRNKNFIGMHSAIIIFILNIMADRLYIKLHLKFESLFFKLLRCLINSDWTENIIIGNVSDLSEYLGGFFCCFF